MPHPYHPKGINCGTCDKRRETSRRASAAKLARKPKADYGYGDCPTCGETFRKSRATHRYCCEDCLMKAPHIRNRPVNPIYRTREHRAARRAYGRQMKLDGGAACSLCGGWISPDEPWHLDHQPGSATEYRGPAHPHCNSVDGASRSRTAYRYKTRGTKPCDFCGKSCAGSLCQQCELIRRALLKDWDKAQRPPKEKRPKSAHPYHSKGSGCDRCDQYREYMRTRSRNRYREQVGIPLDAPDQRRHRL